MDDMDSKSKDLNYYNLLKKKRNIKDELWEDYKSLNINNGYTPIETYEYYQDITIVDEEDE